MSSEDNTPPTVVRVVPGKRKGLKALGDISKPPIKKMTVSNPYLKKRVGIGKLVVPKSTIAPPKPAHDPRIAGTPSHSRIGRGGTDQTPTGTERTPKKATPASRSAGGSEQTNGHISRKKMGKTFNPALEADPSPPRITT